MDIDYGDTLILKNDVVGVVVGFGTHDQVIIQIDENVRTTVPKTVIKTVIKDRMNR
jgi:preprotein translocase subunit YajC